MTLYAVLNQKLYPGAGDVDDCWVVATCWAARIAGVRDLPTVKEFRAAANKPDLPGPTGGSLSDIMRAVRELWPDLGVVKYQSLDWDAFAASLRAGKVASLAVQSSVLPSKLRFGFLGAHQIGVAYQGGFLVANPLAPQGSEPIPITEAALRNAARAVAMGWILAALFPTGEPMQRFHLEGTPIGAYTIRVDTALIAMDESRVPVKAGREGNVFAKATLPDGRPAFLVGYADTTGLLVADERCTFEPSRLLDAAYNEGRDAAVNAAASVPRR